MRCSCVTSNYTSVERAAACHIPRDATTQGCQSRIHGLGDASQLDYAGVVYLRLIDEQGDIHTSLVISETKVVKRSTIPSLDFYGARATCLPLQGGVWCSS